MNIVLFGGAFNPPHIGHLIVIQQALELIKADQLWILPCFKHSFDKDLASPTHRLAMLELLIQEFPQNLQEKVKICPLEIDSKLSGQTHEAVQKLQTEEKYLKDKNLLLPQSSIKDIKYSFLMGSDNLKDFKKWHQWQELIKTINFYIYPRNGYTQEKLYPNMTLLKSDTQVVTNFSSTIMRKRVKQKLSLKNFVPKSILKYLSTHSLY